MKKKLLIAFGIMLLSACSVNGINKDDAKKSAEYINTELSIDDEVKVEQDEYLSEIMDVYRIGEYTTVIPNGDSGIEQINFTNVDEDDISKILEIFEFPDSDSINFLVDNYFNDVASTGHSEPDDAFVIYKDVGISASVKSEILLDVLGEKPFMLSVVYNKDRFADLK